MRRREKVQRGVRHAQALAFIERREKAAALWTITELAESLGISVAQAGALVSVLTAAGKLTRGVRTVVVRDALCTADSVVSA